MLQTSAWNTIIIDHLISLGLKARETGKVIGITRDSMCEVFKDRDEQGSYDETLHLIRTFLDTSLFYISWCSRNDNEMFVEIYRRDWN